MRSGETLLALVAVIVMALLAAGLVFGEPSDSTQEQPYRVDDQLARSVFRTRRILPTTNGSLTVPSDIPTRGAKVASICNWGQTTPVYYMQNATSVADLMSNFNQLSVCPAGVCRSLGAQVSNIGTALATGPGATGWRSLTTMANTTGNPVELLWSW